MATDKDIRAFHIGMDKDSDERVMENGRYRHAENVRLLTMMDGDTAEMHKLRSIDGHVNLSISAEVDAGDEAIGGFEDTETGLVYLFYQGNTVLGGGIIEDAGCAASTVLC